MVSIYSVAIFSGLKPFYLVVNANTVKPIRIAATSTPAITAYKPALKPFFSFVSAIIIPPYSATLSSSVDESSVSIGVSFAASASSASNAAPSASALRFLASAAVILSFLSPTIS